MKEATVNQFKKYGGYVLEVAVWAATKRKLLVLLVAAIGGIAASGTADKVLQFVDIGVQLSQ